MRDPNNKEQEFRLSSSDFYWENLGLSNYKSTEVNVTARIEDFWDFIDRAISSLKRFTFKYTFNVFSRIGIDSADFLVSNEELVLCSDQKCEKQIFKGWIARNQRHISVPGFHRLSLLYVKGSGRSFKVRNSQYLLRDIKPINVNDEEENNVLDTLFQAKDIYHGKNTKKNKLRVLRKSRNRVELEIGDPESELKPGEPLIVAFNTYTLSVQKNALERLGNFPQPHMIPIINLLQQKRFTEWPSFDQLAPPRYGVLTSEASAGTKEQREFVRIALETPDFAILEGPPGSGKTSTLLEIILNLCLTGKRVLMVASTHVAVDNVLERLCDNSSKETSLMNQFGVIPLRIGEEENVSEKVKRFTISNRVEEEKKRLRNFLGSLQSLTEAQNILLSALEKDDGNNIIEKLVLDSSNFICGTTIGILQSRIIKDSSLSEARPPFDCMVIDEASKTTFTEFLVPALFAEKWIISGDPKQLSPYVEQEFIKTVVSVAPSFSRMDEDTMKMTKNVSLDVFNSIEIESFHKYRGALILDEDGTIEEMYRLQADRIASILGQSGAVLPSVYKLENISSPKDRFLVLASRLIIGTKEQIERVMKSIPPGLVIRGVVSDKLQRRETAISEIAEIDDDSQSWEAQISWRLNREYEMRGDEKSKQYMREIELLTPCFRDRPDEERPFLLSRRVNNDLRRIRRTFYPSIIEMLQQGVSDTRREDESESIPIYEGMPPDDFRRRHVLLTYQHRMHPAISKYSRTLFYEEKALKDAPDLERDREWGYKNEYRRRMVWIDKKGGRFSYGSSRSNVNELEVLIVKEELIKFLKWAQFNRSTDSEKWKIALLTFYRGQERALSRMMQEMSGSANHRYFYMKRENVDIEVCTVDRFQGQEADLVFLSMVRRRGVGFLDNRNRMNVAITRAKYQMVIVGDKIPFKKSRAEFLRNMANDIEGPI